MSNARAFLRLGCGACLVSIIACAQGIPSPGLGEGVDSAGGSGGSSGGSLGAAGTYGASGTYGNGTAGTVSQGGALGVAGSSSGSAGHVGVGGSAAGGTGSGGTGTGTGGTGSGMAGTGASVGGGSGTLGCTHLQPGGTLGLQVQYKVHDTTSAYMYFDVEIDNLDDTPVALTELHYRYYFHNDLTAPAADIWTPYLKPAGGNQQDLSGVMTTFTPTYLEVTFAGAQSLNKNDHVFFTVHVHSDPHPQTSDYSFDAAATTLAPSCKQILYQQTALAWGIPPA